jgi:predicted DNA-binding antitoxin AbrB/MazE fold protein
MNRRIPAIFDAGVFRPLQPVDLAEGTQVEVVTPQTSIQPSLDEKCGETNALPWSDFIEKTYGSCAGLGLERHDQGDLERRDSIA